MGRFRYPIYKARFSCPINVLPLEIGDYPKITYTKAPNEYGTQGWKEKTMEIVALEENYEDKIVNAEVWQTELGMPLYGLLTWNSLAEGEGTVCDSEFLCSFDNPEYFTSGKQLHKFYMPTDFAAGTAWANKVGNDSVLTLSGANNQLLSNLRGTGWNWNEFTTDKGGVCGAFVKPDALSSDMAILSNDLLGTHGWEMGVKSDGAIFFATGNKGGNYYQDYTYVVKNSQDDVSRAATFSSTGQQIPLGLDGATSCHAGFRFILDDISQGDVIESAYLKLRANWFAINVRTKIYGEDVDDADPITDAADFDGLSLTSTNITWNFNTDPSWIISKNIGTVVDVVTNRASWGSAINIIVKHSTYGNLTYVKSRDYSSSYAPKLIVYKKMTVPSTWTEKTSPTGQVTAGAWSAVHVGLTPGATGTTMAYWYKNGTWVGTASILPTLSFSPQYTGLGACNVGTWDGGTVEGAKLFDGQLGDSVYYQIGTLMASANMEKMYDTLRGRYGL